MVDQTSGANASGYRVLARKYRPQTFADLIGQDAMVRTLTNAFASGRIAQGFMLTGVRGVGKTTTARLIARALNYGDAPTIDMPAFGPHCEAILESRHMDVIEMDAASNTGVDNMREIIDSVRYAPVSARYKVYIIDEVHMLSKSAFNALLKTLEEPPPHVKFIFATTEINKVPVTILSRCQRFDLRRLDADLLATHYAAIAAKEGVEAEADALAMIARAAEGSVRDGLSLLDQAIAYGEGKVLAGDVAAMLGLMDRSRIIDLFEAVMAGDPARAIMEIEAQHAGGGDPRTILNDLADYVHWVTRIKVVKEPALTDTSRTEAEKSRGRDHVGQDRHGASDAGLVDASQGHPRDRASCRSADGGRDGADPPCACRRSARRRGTCEAGQVGTAACREDRRAAAAGSAARRRAAGRRRSGRAGGEAAAGRRGRGDRDPRLFELQGHHRPAHREAADQAEGRHRALRPADPRQSRPVRTGA